LKSHRDLKPSQGEPKDPAIGIAILRRDFLISLGMTGQMRGKFANFF
jgi:hypothetical protein